MTKKLSLSLAASAAILGGALFISGSPGGATLAQCNLNNATCLWGNDNYDWLLIQKSTNTAGQNLAAAVDNRMDSWQNRSNVRNSRGRDGANGTGDCQTFGLGSKDPNVAFFNSDEVSWVNTMAGC